MWDTSCNIYHLFYHKSIVQKAHGIALVFDVALRISFDDINEWIDKIRDISSDAILVLWGNKVDSEKDWWKVTQEEIDSLIKQKNLVYYVTSAKTHEGINESFDYFVNTAYNKEFEKKNCRI